ncbi:MAG: hypothetical protein NC204_06650 [Candidatus Amulumruptor caecigallinarius]|nr:hypothetical protein [Candidatus Amulumruptor caecigallinarius]
MTKYISFTLLFLVCALQSGAQTLTATYVELADSADRYIRHQRWDDAERVIIKALRHEPANKSNYLLWSNLGIVRTNRGDINGALMAYDIGIASAPNSTMLLSNRARTHLVAGNREKAFADLNHALQLDSTLQWALKMRGLLNVAGGRLQQAADDFNRYRSLYGDDAAVEEGCGDIATFHGNPAEAATHYGMARKLEPEVEDFHVKYLNALLQSKQDNVFREAMAESLKRFPRCGRLYLVRALYNKEHFLNDAMESDLKTAIECGIPSEAVTELLDLRNPN